MDHQSVAAGFWIHRGQHILYKGLSNWERQLKCSSLSNYLILNCRYILLRIWNDDDGGHDDGDGDGDDDDDNDDDDDDDDDHDDDTCTYFLGTMLTYGMVFLSTKEPNPSRKSDVILVISWAAYQNKSNILIKCFWYKQ